MVKSANRLTAARSNASHPMHLPSYIFCHDLSFSSSFQPSPPPSIRPLPSPFVHPNMSFRRTRDRMREAIERDVEGMRAMMGRLLRQREPDREGDRPASRGRSQSPVRRGEETSAAAAAPSGSSPATALTSMAPAARPPAQLLHPVFGPPAGPPPRRPLPANPSQQLYVECDQRELIRAVEAPHQGRPPLAVDGFDVAGPALYLHWVNAVRSRRSGPTVVGPHIEATELVFHEEGLPAAMDRIRARRGAATHRYGEPGLYMVERERGGPLVTLDEFYHRVDPLPRYETVGQDMVIARGPPASNAPEPPPPDPNNRPPPHSEQQSVHDDSDTLCEFEDDDHESSSSDGLESDPLEHSEYGDSESEESESDDVNTEESEHEEPNTSGQSDNEMDTGLD
ncbi:hypothetical protein BDY21DRAFT_401286 [Lineolata rhizophorae]|uniref:Uncharacterized protein n=1 Tax=Lineolata rhizophorae TaxID=578093 RepID=A0A6A6NQE9_9PEZI|nr:hypothetical protein BDY21DRAFT_401286 [Lineolata rhizophorae]